MSQKHILLICPVENCSTARCEAFPSGALLLIGTMLLEKGHKIRVVQMMADRVSTAGLNDIITSFKPDIVGITMSTYQTKSAREVSEAVKAANENILVVVGGPHPSALKLKIFDDFPRVDVVVVGEGEHAFMEIVEGQNLKDIRGICYQGTENGPRTPAPDLDYIPLPNLGLVDIKKYTGADPQIAYPTMFIMGSRGCPFRCTFCNKSIWRRTVKLRKPDLIVDEVEWLYNKYGIREIYFQDDTFNLDRQWAEQIFQLLIDRKLTKKVCFKTSFRANEELVDEEFLRMARSAGFWQIFYGVENGNQEMLDSMGKGLTTHEIKRAFELTHSAGIVTKAAFMMGMPGESTQTVDDTIKLWKEIRPYVTGLGPAIPFPETEFDRIVTQKGHKLTTDYDRFCANAILVRTDDLDGKQIAHLYAKFKRLIIRQFLIDFLKLRYLKVLLFGLKSPWYIYHILRRIRAHLKEA